MVQHLGNCELERLCEAMQVAFRQREPSRHGVSAELVQQTGVPRRHQIQRIAQMQTRNRTSRTFQHAFANICEDHGRPMHPLTNTRRENADHTLMPARLK